MLYVSMKNMKSPETLGSHSELSFVCHRPTLSNALADRYKVRYKTEINLIPFQTLVLYVRDYTFIFRESEFNRSNRLSKSWPSG